jgi:hypothetical protein
VALIKKRLGIQPVCVAGAIGQFDVLVDGEKIATRGGNWLTRSFGAGYPDLDSIVDEIAKRGAARGTP